MRARAAWSVIAGLHPEHVAEEYSRQWIYTEADYQVDRSRRPEEKTRFAEYVEQAGLYARSIQDPGRVNYVKLEFIWY